MTSKYHAVHLWVVEYQMADTSDQV